MSRITDIFYNLFWKNQACHNLFLLSKVELLDTKTIEIETAKKSVSLPHIILSNIEDKNEFEHEKIRLRTDTSNINTEFKINEKIDTYTPIITDFIEDKFGKSLEKLIKDIEEDSSKLIEFLISIFFDEKDIEGNVVEFLQEYGFIGKHINSFDDLDGYIKKELISKDLKSALSENNVQNFLEFIKSVKDIYVNETYKSFYNSNQVLTNALYDSEDFKSRLQLFSLLYDNEIIYTSNEDSFMECAHCSPGTYRGALQLKIDPQKLQELKCPVCSNKLSYYVPYRLNNEIYEIMKSKDGLVFDALGDLLERFEIHYKTNEIFLNDIEVDCFFEYKQKTFVTECKMYKVSAGRNRLKNKVREHFGKLLKDYERLVNNNKIDLNASQAVLLVNITDDNMLNSIMEELREENQNPIAKQVLVMNLMMLREYLKSK